MGRETRTRDYTTLRRQCLALDSGRWTDWQTQSQTARQAGMQSRQTNRQTDKKSMERRKARLGAWLTDLIVSSGRSTLPARYRVAFQSTVAAVVAGSLVFRPNRLVVVILVAWLLRFPCTVEKGARLPRIGFLNNGSVESMNGRHCIHTGT
jgi:Flp pilus assembly protein TadB